MAKNYVQPGGVVEAVAPAAGVVAGVGILIGANLFGVALDTATVGQTFRLATEGVHELAKDAVALAPGAIVYWDPVSKKVDDDALNKEIGLALTDVAGGAATVWVKLVPSCRAINTA